MKSNIQQIITNLISRMTSPQEFKLGDWSKVQPQTIQAKETPQVAPSPQPQQMGQINPELIAKAIQVYGGKNAPTAQYADVIAQATNKYEFLKDNPYLIPAIAHLETSSGKNITRPNNDLNWGINYPGNNQAFSKMTREQVLEKALSGFGERSPYYQKFRTGNPLTDEQIIELAKVYEPANKDYPQNLVNAIKFIQSQVK